MKGESSLPDRDAAIRGLHRAADGEGDFAPLRKLSSCDFAAGTSAEDWTSDTAFDTFTFNGRSPSALPTSVSEALSFPFTRLLRAERRLGLCTGRVGWL